MQKDAQRQDCRAPITDNILKKICQICHTYVFPAYESYLFKAAYLLAYYGLRVSETVLPTLCNHIGHSCCQILITETDSKALQISIRVSKSSQAGLPTVLRHTRNFAVSVMQNCISLHLAGPYYPLCHLNGSPLTQSVHQCFS